MAGTGNTQLPARGQGDVEISYIVNKAELSEIIKDVLFVPGLGVNLFSIASTTETGAEVCFTGNNVTFSRKCVSRNGGPKSW